MAVNGETRPELTRTYLIEHRDFCNERHAALERQQAEQRSYIEERFRQAERAITIALENQDRRFENTNEWRTTVDTIMDTLASKESLAAMVERTNRLELWKSNMEGRFYMIGIGITMVNVGISLALKLWG